MRTAAIALVWIASSAAAPRAKKPSVPNDVVALTNEPFLQAEVRGRRIRVDGVGVRSRWLRVRARTAASGVRTWTASDGAGSVTLAVRGAACADDMSGARYPFSATVAIDGVRANGCARPRRSPPPAVDGDSAT